MPTRGDYFRHMEAGENLDMAKAKVHSAIDDINKDLDIIIEKVPLTDTGDYDTLGTYTKKGLEELKIKYSEECRLDRNYTTHGLYSEEGQDIDKKEYEDALKIFYGKKREYDEWIKNNDSSNNNNSSTAGE